MAIVLILRNPLDARLKQARIGPLAVAAVGVILAIVWFRAAPAEIDIAFEIGEVLGVLGAYLMVVALVLAPRRGSLERWFGGLDGMYRWHRFAAFWAVPFIALHVAATHVGSDGRGEVASDGPHPGEVLGIVAGALLLVLIVISLPRIGQLLRLRYGPWLHAHRVTGLLVWLALLHAWLLDPVVDASLAARVAFGGLVATAIAAYVYDEVVRRHVEAQAPYVVTSVDRVSARVVDVLLTPTGRGAALPVVAGQFVYLVLGNSGIPREHPFSVAGVGNQGSVRLTISAAGRDTGRIYTDLRHGTPATLRGPYGLFDFTVGGRKQIWIAGGIGIAPFLGWISRHPGGDYDIDVFYTAASELDMPFREELAAAAAREPGLRFHAHQSDVHGRLAVSHIAEAVGGLHRDTHVFMCGPAAMVREFRRGLHQLGIPLEHIHAEHFAFRGA